MDIRTTMLELRKQLAQAIKDKRAGDVLAAAKNNPRAQRGFEQRGGK